MQKWPVVLVMAKEREWRKVLVSHLQGDGYLLLTAHDTASAIEAAEGNAVALALVDLPVPVWHDGLTVCQTVRRTDFRTFNDRTGAIPLLVMVAPHTSVGSVGGAKSARTSESTVRSVPSKPGIETTTATENDPHTVASQPSGYESLELAAEEYLFRPFAWATLRVRIRAALRPDFGQRVLSHELYPATLEEGVLMAGELRIDLGRREVTLRGRPIEYLKPRLFDLLVYFVRNQGVPLTPGQLMSNVWGYILPESSKSLRVHICWLRDVLEDDAAHPTFIETIPHVGYRFVNEWFSS